MPWLLIDNVSQKVNGFRYVSTNKGIFLICSYRQSGGVIIVSTVSGHVETVCLLVNKKADMKVHVRIDMDEYEGIKGGKK